MAMPGESEVWYAFATVHRFAMSIATKRETNGFLCFQVELTITGAWKSLCKALEHIATAFWPPCGWNATFCYTILSEQGAQRVDFGTR